jgi:hypothetical protein
MRGRQTRDKREHDSRDDQENCRWKVRPLRDDADRGECDQQEYENLDLADEQRVNQEKRRWECSLEYQRAYTSTQHR